VFFFLSRKEGRPSEKGKTRERKTHKYFWDEERLLLPQSLNRQTMNNDNLKAWNMKNLKQDILPNLSDCQNRIFVFAVI
jgi:hypothetical protein